LISQRIVLGEPSELEVSLEVADAAPADSPLALAPVALLLDGVVDQEILVLPGSGRERYTALVGPLGRGEHSLGLGPSAFLAAGPRIAWKRLAARVTPPSDPDRELLAHAPRFYLRADTVGRADDIPLYVYAEVDETPPGRTLRYTAVFSNEDGGTPAI